MNGEPGRRERKKQRTRQALIDAAFKLFEERGYDRTTVADIAEAADVSPRTFFLHFPAKEDVVLASNEARVNLALIIIEGADPGERPGDVLVKAMKAVIDHVWETDLSTGIGARRVKLLLTSQDLQAAMLRLYFNLEVQLIAAIQRVFPGRMDPISASATVGAMVGALVAVTLTSLQQGDTADQTRDTMLATIQRVADQLGLSETDARPES